MKRIIFTVFFVPLIIHSSGFLAIGDCIFEHESCIARPEHSFEPCTYGQKIVGCHSCGFGEGCVFIPDYCSPLLSNTYCDDSDGDSIPDYFEINGMSLDPIFSPTIIVDLPGMGSHHLRADLFVEIDCLVDDVNGNGIIDPVDHTHCPIEDAIQDVVRSFANAPIFNPDFTTGIQLHIDTGPLFGEGVIHQIPGNWGVTGNYGDLRDSPFGGYKFGGGDKIPENGNEIIDYDGNVGDPATNFYDLKSQYFDKYMGVSLYVRPLIFRYSIFAHQTNARDPINDATSGVAEGIPCNDFFVTLGRGWGQDVNGFSVGSRREQAGTFMHELGHCLGLRHGGGDDENNKPNYLSVMNYVFQSCWVPAIPAALVPGGCNYSGIKLNTLYETNLDECEGVDGGLGFFGAVDWDNDNLIEGLSNCNPPNNVNVNADINGSPACIRPGNNGILNSVTGGDDVVDVNRIRDGANRTCDSTNTPDDILVRAVGDVQRDDLVGFDDWDNIKFGFTTLANFVDGVAAPVQDEPDFETIEKARQMISKTFEPILVVDAVGPENVSPGDDITYNINLQNVGKGPGLNVVLTNIFPDGSSQDFNLGTFVVGANSNIEVPFTIPSNSVEGRLRNQVIVNFTDFAGLEKVESVFIETNRVPFCNAGGPYLLECAGPGTYVTLNGSGSSDPDGDPLSFAWSGPFGSATGTNPTVQYSGIGQFSANLFVSDNFGGTGSCSANVAVVDTTGPTLACNAPATIVLPDAPISITVTASDICSGEVTAEIVGYDCFTYTQKMKPIDKKGSCIITFAGNTITISDPGGVGDIISWVATATDASEKTGKIECKVEVLNPGKNK